MKPFLARLLALHGQLDWESRVDAETKVLSAQDSASWEAAEKILRNHGTALRRKYPFLSEGDVARLVERVMRRLRSAEGLRKLSVAGSPAGYLGVLLENAGANLSAQRKSAFLAANLGLLDGDEKRLFAMAFVQRRTIGEIAQELGKPYAEVAGRFFRMLHRMRGDGLFQLPPAPELTENKDFP